MSIPILKVEKRTIPETWEESVVACWNLGIPIPTEYDKPGDPNSRDCIMIMRVTHPLAEARIHKSMPGGLKDLRKYVREVVDGVHDHWIDPEHGKWSYTYSDRIKRYTNGGGIITNQFESVVQKLLEVPHTRRAQMSIWKPWVDSIDEHAPCLQRVWFRIANRRLHCNIHIRSNDAYKAGFMNMYAFVELQRDVMLAYNTRCNLNAMCTMGPYTHIADSYHIYGSYFQEFEERFLKMLKTRSFEERVLTDEFAQEYFDEADRELEIEQEAERKAVTDGMQ